jgi:hypothetical protein
VSTSKNNGKPDTFLAPAVLQLTGAISTAMDLLEAAGGLMLLREVLEPDTPEYENATQELAKFLVLARVSIADALAVVEADDES